jgi:hypothetical protein
LRTHAVLSERIESQPAFRNLLPILKFLESGGDGGVRNFDDRSSTLRADPFAISQDPDSPAEA